MLNRIVLIGAALAAGSMLAGAVGAKPAITVTNGRDSAITHALQRKLLRQFPDTATRLHVKTLNGVVTLSGLADSDESALEVIHDAQSMHGVKRVRDRLSVVS